MGLLSPMQATTTWVHTKEPLVSPVLVSQKVNFLLDTGT